jgi:hypothetical protein
MWLHTEERKKQRCRGGGRDTDGEIKRQRRERGSARGMKDWGRGGKELERGRQRSRGVHWVPRGLSCSMKDLQRPLSLVRVWGPLCRLSLH